jgi:two-component system, NarL family, nitrate/nitrite sensor histidine kinase NarX
MFGEAFMKNHKIQSSGRRGQALAGRSGAIHVAELDMESRESTPNQGGELWSLLEGFLSTITVSLGAHAGTVRVISSNGTGLQMVGAIGLPSEIFKCEDTVDIGCGVCGQAACCKEIFTSDADVCERRMGVKFFDKDCGHVVAVPVEYHGNLIGVLTLFYADAKDIPVNAEKNFRAFADLIGITLEKTRLNREHRRISLIAERQAMANEIHDSLAQTLVYSKMRTSLLLEAMRTHDELLAFKCAGDIDEALANGQKAVRELITHFRCQMDPLGLLHALQTLVAEFRERTDISLEFTNRVADLNLPLEHELQIFYIVREALTNISIHSGATDAKLNIRHSGDRYIFSIEDNGGGMYKCASIDGHYGLLIMRERAQRIGGEIQIDSIEDAGTRVQLILPDSET